MSASAERSLFGRAGGKTTASTTSAEAAYSAPWMKKQPAAPHAEHRADQGAGAGHLVHHPAERRLLDPLAAPREERARPEPPELRIGERRGSQRRATLAPAPATGAS